MKYTQFQLYQSELHVADMKDKSAFVAINNREKRNTGKCSRDNSRIFRCAGGACPVTRKARVRQNGKHRTSHVRRSRQHSHEGLCQQWSLPLQLLSKLGIQTVDFPHRDVFVRIDTFDRDLISVK